MKDVSEYDKDSILSEGLFLEVFDEPDEIERARTIIALQNRAKELKVKSQFDALINAYKRIGKRMESESVRYTDFAIPIDSRYQNMDCDAVRNHQLQRDGNGTSCKLSANITY